MKKFLATFWLSVILTVLFALVQIRHMIIHGTQGISTSAFALSWIFVALSLVLSIRAYKAVPTLKGRLVAVNLSIGILLYSSLIIVLLIKSKEWWVESDTVTCLVAAFLTSLCILGGILSKDLKWDSPLMIGLYIIISKAVPNGFLAWKVHSVGGGGMSTTFIALYHVLVFLRLYQMWESGRATKWNKDSLFLFIGECSNELSWIVVTIAWL